MALSDRVVVMDQGRILQIGAPEAIYRRPVSRTVAAFFGQPNLLAARVVSCEAGTGGGCLLVVEGAESAGPWSGPCRAEAAVATGTVVTVVVRPETIVLTREPAIGGAGTAGQSIGWTGTVAHSTFRGASCSLVVTVGPDDASQRLGVETPALGAPAVGDRVRLSVVPGGAWAVMG